MTSEGILRILIGQTDAVSGVVAARLIPLTSS